MTDNSEQQTSTTPTKPLINKTPEAVFTTTTSRCMARPERFERPTPWFVAKYSIQLSYGRAAFSKRRILQTN